MPSRYEHKHQDLSGDDPTRGLNRMARDVGTHLLRTLAAAGVVLSEGLLLSLQAAYQREAEDAVADSYAVAAINSLQYDRHQEELNVQTFLSALARRHRRVPSRPARPAPRAQLGARVGRQARRRPSIAGRRCGGPGRHRRVSACPVCR